MKLFLSSEKIPCPELLEQLICRPAGETSVAVINNAYDTYAESTKADRYQAVFFTLDRIGFRQTVIDLRNYHNEADRLQEDLSWHQFIWCSGGNTFWLRYLMRTSGFEVVIRDLLDSGIVYGGESAGAVSVGPSLHPIELLDPLELAPETIWDGIGLTKYIVWPHIGKEKYRSIESQITKRLQESVHPVIALHDGQAVILVDDHEPQLVEGAI